MRLRAFSVDGYRGFADRTPVELRPLTLLFGYNSAGKSALLRVLPLLAASVDSTLSGPLALKSRAARDAAFSNLLCQLVSRPSIRFELAWDAGPGELERLRFTVRDLPEARRQVVERLLVTVAGQESGLELEWSPAEGDAASARYRIRFGEWEDLSGSLAFEGLVPVLAPERAFSSEIVERIREVQDALRSLRAQVHWLEALRELPPRRLDYRGPPERLHPTGRGATEALAYDALGDGALMRLVSSWYERATRHRLSLVRDSRLDSELVSAMLGPVGQVGVRVPILDAGEGMGQVLPILVLGGMARLGRLGADPVLVVEHPELHLQPAVHAELAEFFCDLASLEAPPNLLVETHSENFLLRVQLEILHGRLPPDRVLVYWIRQEEDGRSTATPVRFDELGRPVGDRWPPGVFSTAPEQASEIVRERRKRRGA